MESIDRLDSPSGLDRIMHGEGLPLTTSARYLLAAALFFAVLVTQKYFAQTGSTASLFMYDGAIAASALLLGLGPASLIALLAIAAATLDFALVQPAGTSMLRLISFDISCGVIFLLAAGMQFNLRQSKTRQLRLQDLYDNSPCGYHSLDRNGYFLEINATEAGWLGYPKNELIGKRKLVEFFSADSQKKFWEKFSQFPQDGKADRGEYELVGRDGQIRYIVVTSSALRDEHGNLIASRTVLHDVTERHHAETERSKLSRAVEQSPDSIVITDTNGKIEYVNQAFVDKSGYERSEILGNNPRMLQSGKTSDQVYATMWQTLKRGEVWQGELTNRTRNGAEFIVLSTMSPITQADGKITNFVAIQEDITERKHGEKKIIELAFYDQLTGLPNRTLLLDRLHHAMATGERSGNCGAMLFIDLDHFKSINDTAGHNVGDLLLQKVAQILRTCMREQDTIARFGGDEFVVLLPELNDNAKLAATAAKTAALKILNALDHNFVFGDTAHHCTASIGVTIFSGARTNEDELLKQADMSMYQAKKAGRNTVCFFDPQLATAVRQRAELENEMRHALESQQFQLHYQPQYDDRLGLIGAEVLVRWMHPQRGMISPALFIPHAEETGLILPLGTWVLETACSQLAAWSDHPVLGQLTLAVNVSAEQFRQSDFVEQVQSVITRSQANPQRLKLELTESMLVDKIDDVIAKMTQLKKLGIAFSLDDFGTGYSSLIYLKRLPLDQLKIDQSFVRDVLIDPNDATIAKTITELAQSFGLHVIAEGVETQSQRAFLAEMGCRAYQGYLFGRPVPVGEFVRRVLDQAAPPSMSASVTPAGNACLV